MHQSARAARCGDRRDEVLQSFELASVEIGDRRDRFPLRALHDADAHLDRYGHAYALPHGRYAICNTRLLAHQTGTECAASDALARATTIEIDLAVTCLLARCC